MNQQPQPTTLEELRRMLEVANWKWWRQEQTRLADHQWLVEAVREALRQAQRKEAK